ncbi:MAG TPA: hypothetical protein VKQ72_04690 [Aggregatilineales bacterium]|nr:hypothetical protein [Aggregatilineales bacterium]
MPYTAQQWEYRNFSYRIWMPGETWSSLGDPRRDASVLASDYFWRQAETRIRAALRAYMLDGWELEEALGPQCIRLRRTVKIDWKVNGADVLLWFMTLGIALLVQLLLNMPRFFITYEPVECRLRLRREQVQPVKVTA